MVLARMPGALKVKILGSALPVHRLKHSYSLWSWCVRWQKYGLAAPMAVTQATEEYLQAEDTIALWIEECCETGDGRYKAANREVFASWREWCERDGSSRARKRVYLRR
jgi:phage/plasmid-associated DNA primase